MEQQLVKNEKKEITNPMAQSWGSEELDSSDILIPRLLLMQGLSERVTQGKAASGEFCDNVEWRKYGGKDKQVELVLVDHFKNWVISEKGPKENKFNFNKIVPWKDGNPTWEFESYDEPSKITTRRHKCLNFYVLPVADLDGLPLLLSFRGTSYGAGKQVVTLASRGKMVGKPLGWKTVKLGSNTKTNDLGTFYVFTVEPGRESKKEELEKAFEWHQIIRKGTAKVAEDDLGSMAEPSQDVPF